MHNVHNGTDICNVYNGTDMCNVHNGTDMSNVHNGTVYRMRQCVYDHWLHVTICH